MKPPIYKITIDPLYSDGEDLGIEQIAFTSNPAIKVKGMAFNSEEKKKLFFVDEVKMRIAAPALIPMEIYRNDQDGEYYVEFTVEEIDTIHSKFMSNLSNKNKFNLEHNTNKTVPAYILETWIVDEPLKDKAYSTFGLEVPKGTLMVITQITDKEYYTSLVENGQVGYSIEGFLGLKLSDLQTAEELINNKIKKDQMSKTELKGVVLPEGTTFEIEGKKYIIVGGEITEAPIEEVPAEVKTPVEEVKMADVITGNTVTPTEVTNPAVIDEATILTIIQPKLDEIYKMIADLKVADDVEDMAEGETEMKDCGKTTMSIHDKFKAVSKLFSEE